MPLSPERWKEVSPSEFTWEREALDFIRQEAGPDNIALTMGLVGVHAPNYPVNLIHLWNGGP